MPGGEKPFKEKENYMKRLLVLFCALALAGAWSGVGLADETDEETTHDVTITVDEVAELGIVGDDVSFTVGSDADPGDPFKVTPINQDAKYLQYTSIVDDGSTRKITVQQTDALPDGVTLKVTPAAPSGGQGDKGTQVGSAIDLGPTKDDGAADVVTEIGSCYTGTEGTDGVQLTYELTVENDDVSSLKTLTETAYTITYTLTEGAGAN
jgi:hypothetical protein